MQETASWLYYRHIKWCSYGGRHKRLGIFSRSSRRRMLVTLLETRSGSLQILPDGPRKQQSTFLYFCLTSIASLQNRRLDHTYLHIIQSPRRNGWTSLRSLPSSSDWNLHYRQILDNQNFSGLKAKTVHFWNQNLFYLTWCIYS